MFGKISEFYSYKIFYKISQDIKDISAVNIRRDIDLMLFN